MQKTLRNTWRWLTMLMIAAVCLGLGLRRFWPINCGW